MRWRVAFVAVLLLLLVGVLGFALWLYGEMDNRSAAGSVWLWVTVAVLAGGFVAALLVTQSVRVPRKIVRAV